MPWFAASSVLFLWSREGNVRLLQLNGILKAYLGVMICVILCSLYLITYALGL